MGGYQSPLFKDYRQRCIQAFNVARRHAKAVLTLMEIMQAHSNYPAFRYNPNAIRDFRARLFLDRPDSDLPSIIDQLIAKYVFRRLHYSPLSFACSVLPYLSLCVWLCLLCSS